jgi:hypothetical protein
MLAVQSFSQKNPIAENNSQQDGTASFIFTTTSKTHIDECMGRKESS